MDYFLNGSSYDVKMARPSWPGWLASNLTRANSVQTVTIDLSTNTAEWTVTSFTSQWYCLQSKPTAKFDKQKSEQTHIECWDVW